jgi:Uma2 family endonuclease
MSTTTFPTLAHLVERLGSIPLERISAVPAPGTATEQDVFTRPGGEKRLHELADGILVEKPMGYYESILALVLARAIAEFLDAHNLGVVMGPDATLRLAPGLVRLPDISFVSWDRFPGGLLPEEPVPDLVPDLAVEVLRRGNTHAEMDRKVREYFAAGTRLVWLFDHERRTARVYDAVDRYEDLDESGVLDGRDVLPGFRLAVADWLAGATRRPSAD